MAKRVKASKLDQSKRGDKPKAEGPRQAPVNGELRDSETPVESRLPSRIRQTKTRLQEKLAHPASGIGISLRRVLSRSAEWDAQSENALRVVARLAKRWIRALRVHCPSLPPVPTSQSADNLEAILDGLVEWSDNACLIPVGFDVDWSSEAEMFEVGTDSMNELLGEISLADNSDMIRFGRLEASVPLDTVHPVAPPRKTGRRPADPELDSSIAALFTPGRTTRVTFAEIVKKCGVSEDHARKGLKRVQNSRRRMAQIAASNPRQQS